MSKINAYLEQEIRPRLFNNARHPRHTYRGAIEFLMQYFERLPFQRVSTLENTAIASHAILAKWGTELLPFFYFQNDPAPQGKFLPN